MSDRRLRLYIIIISGALVFAAGCATRQQAVDFYVDAVTLRENNDNQEALRKLNKAVEIDKNFSLAHSLLGEIYEQMSNYPRAADSYENATKLNPWSFKDYFSLGRVYQTMKDFAHAVNAYRRAAQLKPDHFEANLNTAECLYQIKNYDEALAYGKKAELINPDIAELQQLLGQIYDAQKDYDKSVDSYKRALEINSNDPAVMISLAVAYMRTDRTEPAKELLTAVTRLQPDNSSAWQYLGYCFLRLNDLNQAIVNYRKAIEINSRDWEAYRGLGVAYMLVSIKDEDDGLKTQAVELWRQSLSIKPDQPKRERLVQLIEKYSK